MAIPAKIPAILVLLLAVLFSIPPAGAMINPSAGYCEALGYQYTDAVAADGSMTGFCALPQNRSVDAWQFLEGKTAPELSYCKKQGLEVRTVTDPAVCGVLGDTCAVCVRADGSTQEVTKMMGLDFREKICSGNVCCDPRNDTACSLGLGSDGSAGAGTAAQKDGFPLAAIGIIVLIIVAAVAFLAMRKKKSSEPKNP